MNELPLDLQCVVDAVVERCNACRLVALGDVEDELPTRTLTGAERAALMQVLAGHGIEVIGPRRASAAQQRP